MADLYPNIHFPKIDFSGLAELPSIYEEAQGKSALKESLADLDSSNPKSLRDAAARAFRIGTKESLATGAALSAAAQHQEDNRTRAAQLGLQTEYLKTLRNAGPLTGGLPSAAPAEPAPYVPAPGGGSAAAPSPFDRPPGQIPGAGPRSEALPESPSNQMIAQAQEAVQPSQPAPGPVPGPQLAGPPPTPDTPPAVPAWLQGAQMQAEATPALPQAPQALPDRSPRQQAMEEANFWTNKAKEYAGPRGLGAGIESAIRKRIDDALARAKPSQLENDFIQENLRRASSGKGEPLLRNPAEYESMVKLAPQLTEKAHVTYEKDYRDRDQKAESVTQDLTAIAELTRNPRFAPGEPGLLDSILNKVGSVNDKLKSIGVPESMLLSAEQVKSATTPVALREAVAGLAGRAVISSLGGLGRQVSDTDREYMANTFGSLMMTKQGMAIVHKFMGEVAERQKFQAATARDYLKDNNRATTAEMDRAVDEAMTKKYGTKGLLSYDNGNPTLLRLQMDKALVAPPVAPPSARQVAPRGFDRDAAKAAGYSDAEIDAHLRGQ